MPHRSISFYQTYWFYDPVKFSGVQQLWVANLPIFPFAALSCFLWMNRKNKNPFILLFVKLGRPLPVYNNCRSPTPAYLSQELQHGYIIIKKGLLSAMVHQISLYQYEWILLFSMFNTCSSQPTAPTQLHNHDNRVFYVHVVSPMETLYKYELIPFWVFESIQYLLLNFPHNLVKTPAASIVLI